MPTPAKTVLYPYRKWSRVDTIENRPTVGMQYL